MKHADLKTQQSTLASQQAAFESLAQGVERRYLIRADIGEVYEAVVTPRSDGTVDVRMVQTTLDAMSRGTTDLSGRPLSSIDADDLLAFAAIRQTVAKWVAGELDALPPSNVTEETYAQAARARAERDAAADAAASAAADAARASVLEASKKPKS